MTSKYDVLPLSMCCRELASVAQGNLHADTVIRNARLINVCTKEILPKIDVAISCGRIALVGDAKHCIGSETKVIDANGDYIAPGFLDGHMHIESSMLTVGEYARGVVPHGTTGVFMDPHEICNVLGLDGVGFMIDDARRTPLKSMITMPSCVPAVPGFEDTGAYIGPEEVALAMKWDGVVGLGEMMNFPGVLSSSDSVHAIIGETLKAGKTVTGHYSLPETGKGLNAYIASGVRCCHESTREEDALTKMRLGMYAMLREGSAWCDLHQVAPAITNHEVDSRFAMLVSDDIHPQTMIEEGHLDFILRRAVEEGIDIITAIQMVTINCAQCFHLDHEIGSITPGKCADIVFIKDLKSVEVTKVIINGNVVAEDGKLVTKIDSYTYPEKALHSMHIRDKITPSSFRIETDKEGTVETRVIEIIPSRVGTKERQVNLKVNQGQVESDIQQDVLKMAVFERHHKTGTIGYGFVKGFGIENGAVASTVSHDAHNLTVIGTNDEDMAIAANTLVDCGGGFVIVQSGKVLALLPLPIAGLMNEKSAKEMSEYIQYLEEALHETGCFVESAFMTMSILSLACIPEIRLTNRGLVDSKNYNFTHLFLEQRSLIL